MDSFWNQYTSVASAVNCRIKSVTTIQVVKSLRIDTTLVHRFQNKSFIL